MRKSVCLSIASLVAGAWLSGCGGEEPAAVATRPAPPTTVGSEAPSTPPPTAPPVQLRPGQEQDIFPFLVVADVETDEGKAPLTVRFKSEIQGGVPPYRFVWNFGDGTPEVTERNPTHTFATPGVYRVDLIARDAQNEVDSDYVTIEVK